MSPDKYSELSSNYPKGQLSDDDLAIRYTEAIDGSDEHADIILDLMKEIRRRRSIAAANNQLNIIATNPNTDEARQALGELIETGFLFDPSAPKRPVQLTYPEDHSLE